MDAMLIVASLRPIEIPLNLPDEEINGALVLAVKIGRWGAAVGGAFAPW